jgi:putative glutamine amidotransferase
MNSKPLIGINSDFRSAKAGKDAYSYLAAGYADALQKVGAIPVILPILDEESDLDELLDRLDGMIMIGGNDLDPRNDGFMLHPSVRPMEPRRESFDRALMQKVFDRKIPVFGIGVGMQLINLTAGGNLFLHIPEDMPNALPHRDMTDPNHRHALEIEMGTIMERIYGEGEIRVNSMHHMSIDEVAPGFVVTARCPDGVIEAIESIRDDWFAFGTQFHPEAISASALDLQFFEEFVCGVMGKTPELQLVA